MYRRCNQISFEITYTTRERSKSNYFRKYEKLVWRGEFSNKEKIKNLKNLKELDIHQMNDIDESSLLEITQIETFGVTPIAPRLKFPYLSNHFLSLLTMMTI